MRSYNPEGARSLGLGCSLFARHYSGNHYFIFFSSRYLDVSVLGVGSPFGVIRLQRTGDLILVCSSPQLIAAYHVLHRLSEPRHPPCALSCFKKFEIVLLPDHQLQTTNYLVMQKINVIDKRLFVLQLF
jgi:hypothetical protein